MTLNMKLNTVIESLTTKMDLSIQNIEQVKDTANPEKVYDVYRIYTKDNKDYILKLDSQGYEYTVYKQIFSKKDLPVPSCLQTVEIDSDKWLLISHVGNQDLMKADLNQYLVAARNLATIHSQLAKEDLTEYVFLRNKATKISIILDYLKDNNKLPSEVTQRILEAGERLIKRPFTLIHGDLLPINIVNNNGEAFFIDWEIASLGCYAHDLGRLLGDIRDQQAKYWVNPSWKRQILEGYYNSLSLNDDIEWKDFIHDFDCACIWNYAEIVFVHLNNDWELTPWYHANVRAISEYKATVS